METETFSPAQNEWLNELAGLMIELGMFEQHSIEQVRSKIDEYAFLEYFDSGLTAKEAIEEDCSYS